MQLAIAFGLNLGLTRPENGPGMDSKTRIKPIKTK
jgi:hypothetical protein